MQNMIGLTQLYTNKNIKNQKMYFDSKNQSALYYSSVKQTRPSSAHTHQKRSSVEWNNQLKPLNYAPPAYLTNSKKEDYKFNLLTKLSASYLIDPQFFLQTVKAVNNFNEKEYLSKSVNKYNDASSNENMVIGNARKKDSQVDQKQPMSSRPRRSSQTINLSHIMQKIQKKEKLIKELQKICENKVSDNIRRSSEDKQRTQELIGAKLIQYSPVATKNEKSPHSQKYRAANEIPDLDLNLSTISSKSKKDSNFSYLKQLQSLNIVLKRQSDCIKSYKNPEQNLLNSERLHYSHNWSPKDYKGELKSKQSSKIQIEKISSNLDIPYSDKTYEKYKSSTYNSYNYIDVGSPTLQKKKESQISNKDRKHAKDVRNMMETRNIEKKSSYFSSRKISINDFDLKKTLGQGKFGVVYQAFHIETNTLYALKKISKKVIKSNLMIDQVLQEIKIQFYCSHQNILKIYGFFDDSQFIYLILEYMDESTLFASLKKQKTLSQNEAALKLKDIAKAIVYLQLNGIAHRDIKPQNIVMSNGVCKLCDFGWAAICTDRRKTYCGTFDYVAPEILEGNQYNITVDLWCLGVMAYQLMVGKAPFYHISRKQTMKKIMNVQKTTLQFPSHLTKNAISFIQSLIRKNPDQRLQGDSIMKHPFLAQNYQNID